jgi:hypothetical protein
LKFAVQAQEARARAGRIDLVGNDLGQHGVLRQDRVDGDGADLPRVAPMQGEVGGDVERAAAHGMDNAADLRLADT